jgi:DNA-binding NarL/FixJ family response regulator
MKTQRADGTSTGEGAEPLRVCLLWRHPLVASNFREEIDGRRFILTDFRIPREISARAEAPFVTDAALVVVDSEAGNALPVLARLESLSPAAKTVVLEEHFDDEASAFQLLRAGVKGLLTYGEISERLCRALESVAGGGYWVPRALLSRFVETTVSERAPRWPVGRTATLTPREREVLDQLLKNLSNKEIARNLRISGRTAKFHVSNVMAKYGVKRRADLLLLSFPQH